MDLLVVAKEPVPGRVKTRLCPPCSSAEAAVVATAALADTLEAAMASGADRVVMALDGRPGAWCPPGVVVTGQGGGTFDRRLTSAWAATRGPTVQIGMDTPQVTPAVLDAAMAMLVDDGVDAVLGPATDGGWWALGLHRRHPLAFLGVPMSEPDTGACQRERLRALGLRTRLLPALTDLDTWPDAVTIADAARNTRVATVVRTLSPGLAA